MGIFDTYNNINEKYVPKCHTKPVIEDVSDIRYGWNSKESVCIDISFSGQINVDTDSIIYVAIGESPTEDTAGKIGQKAYNVRDYKSWTCVAIIDNLFVWELDADFVYDESKEKAIYFSIADYLKCNGKTFNCTFYNNRYNEVYNIVLPASQDIHIDIPKELSCRFSKGVYYLDVVLCDECADEYTTVLHNVEFYVN